MAYGLIDIDKYIKNMSDIANVLRAKLEITGKISVDEFASMIEQLIKPSSSNNNTNSGSSSSGSTTQDLNCYMIQTDIPMLTGHYVPHESYVRNGQPVYYNETTAGSDVAFAFKEANCWKIAYYTVDDAFLSDWEGYFNYSAGGNPRFSSNNPEKLEDCVFENCDANESFWYDGMTTTITKCVSH